ncbi:MAG: acyl-CoA dehydrogenase family protein [Deltaproteobacteria bacterium]|nr:acyl-CoA dehydrogenase family protein [Deltaproteobacteria bacterium]
MAENFYSDNYDLKFHLEELVDWKSIIELMEDIGSNACPYSSVAQAVETYLEMLRDSVGDLAANRIAPRAAAIDKKGCVYQDGEVIYPQELKDNIADLANAGLTGITFARKYDGMYLPKTFYAAANEIISRADASLMNFFGMQGIGGTIEHFGSEQLRLKYLPRLASGEWTAAMLLTEPDAGSELGAIRTKATYDPDSGQWRINGTKRFITFGCGEVLVTLARSEDPAEAPGTKGISVFVVEKGPGVRVDRIESKLGIHGSPTCEISFEDAPACLVGERGRGLTKYGAWLMKEARLGVAAQAVGISQAALVAAQRYADERVQFGQKIKEFPQVAEMLADMQMYTEASRILLYAAAQVLDIEEGTRAREAKGLRKISRMVDILTPLAKYYAAEVSIAVTNNAVQIHGGSGYTREYPVERYLRDARITSIYEGTSQIQVDWAIVRILRGGMEELLQELSKQELTDPALLPLLEKAKEGHRLLNEAIAYVNSQEPEYWDLVARKIVDMAIDVYISYEFLRQAEKAANKLEIKAKVARRFVNIMLPRVEMNRRYAMNGQVLDF